MHPLQTNIIVKRAINTGQQVFISKPLESQRLVSFIEVPDHTREATQPRLI